MGNNDIDIIVGRCLLLPSFWRETDGTDCTRILLPSNLDSVSVSLFVFISDLTNSTIVLLWDEQACLGTCGPIDLNFWFNPWFWPNVTKVFLDSFPYLWKNNGNHEQRYDKWTSLIPQSLLVHNYGGGSYIQRVIGHINAFWTFHKSVTNETRYEQPLLYFGTSIHW